MSKKKVKEEIQQQEGEVMTDNTETQATEEKKLKRPKKLRKDLSSEPGKVVLEVLDGTMGKMVFDPKDLPESVQANLPAFALGHKLGDSAAGKHGAEAEATIMHVWDEMIKGNWSVRAPAQPTVTKKSVQEGLATLDEDKKKAAMAALEAIGMGHLLK